MLFYLFYFHTLTYLELFVVVLSQCILLLESIIQTADFDSPVIHYTK